ncbi:MAG TPA: hypothetical protein VHG30_02505 [Microvirga sp.]|nr:hypothetical protein [Microvirga sp.]
MRLFFHLVSKHVTLPDPEGIEVADLRQARAQVLQYVREIQDGDPSGTVDMRDWTFLVTDAAGTVVFSLKLENLYVLDRQR